MVETTTRKVYKSVKNLQTHLVQSTEIATTCVCPFLLKLMYPFGLPSSDKDYTISNCLHDVMSIISPKILVENWECSPPDPNKVVSRILSDSLNELNFVISEKKDEFITYGKNLPSDFEAQMTSRLRSLLTGLVTRIMKKYDAPKRILTEVTITNIKNSHEGRLDALFELEEGYGVVDWKTKDLNKATGGHEKWQLISNMLLANHRYTGNEDDWNGCIFGTLVYNEGAYIPKLPMSSDYLNKVKEARDFAHEVLCGRSPAVCKPAFCCVCDTGQELSQDCKFFREDTMLAREHLLPESYRKVRALVVNREYRVLEERAETYHHKFVLHIVINELGEEKGIMDLKDANVIYTDYKFHSIIGNCITLKKSDNMSFLKTGKVVRLIGREPGISILSSVSESGIVNKIKGNQLELKFMNRTSVERVKNQIIQHPLIIMLDEINLTRRVLEPLNGMHKLAAQTILGRGNFSFES